MNTKFNGPSELMVTRNSSVNRFEVTIEGHLAKVDLSHVRQPHDHHPYGSA